ncbi:MAG: DegT/DnrJ/EryC1/StrS family aminotransferase [Candidatus Aminicenantes bacterium]|nr:DegT/DnrJ/EryC1/StrS family aminotransferase [Candidatus Aminicenantes bacterium]
MQIPLSNPDLTDLEREAVLDVLKTPNLSLGPKIPEFENKIAAFAGTKFAVAMSGGTAVLHTIIKALDIGEGDYALTTPFSFIATSNCLLFEKAKPLFVDIDEDTYNITPQAVEKAYWALPQKKREKVKAVIYVDVFGVPADGPGFERTASAPYEGPGKGAADSTAKGTGGQISDRLHIIDDSAEALGSSINQRRCGSFGAAGVFAFYPNKQITTGEGGVLVTNEKSIARTARSLRNQGRDEGAGWLQHARLGYNYRMSDINAALGIAQLERIEEIIKKRRKVKEMYDGYFSKIFDKGLLIPQKTPTASFVVPFVYVLRLADRFGRVDRDRLLDYLRSEGIQCSNYFTPIHLQPPYEELGWKRGDMPITEKISERTVALPFYNNLKEEQIEYVFQKTAAFFKQKF